MAAASDFTSTGGRIRTMRLAKGWTQEVLAKRVHVSQPAVAQWETDRKTPSRQSRILLAEALGVTQSFLFGEAAA